MTNVDWYVEGIEFGNCNCVYGCPRQFEDGPTDNLCKGFEVVRIDKGHFGDTKLDGLTIGLLYSWPGPVYEGGGQIQAIIDERADDAQRAALVEILHGRETEPGATMLQIFSTTLTKTHDALFLPIEIDIDIDGRTARVRVPEQMQADLEPIRNPVTGNPHRARIELPQGFEYTTAEIGSATFKTHGEIKHDYANVHGHVTMLHLTQSGPVR